jgi:hypothetical protein
MKKINWLDHLVNLIVVVTGITLAFTLNSWKDNKQRDKIESDYLSSLIKDLDLDIIELDTLIDQDKIQLITLGYFFKINETSTLNDSVNLAFSQLGSFNSFEGQNVTYESLKYSGKMESLWELDMRIKILENYHSSYNAINSIEEYYQKNYDNNILPLFIDELSSDYSTEQLRTTILGPRFKQIVGLHISFLKQKITAYVDAHKTSMQLKSDLERRLKDL